MLALAKLQNRRCTQKTRQLPIEGSRAILICFNLMYIGYTAKMTGPPAPVTMSAKALGINLLGTFLGVDSFSILFNQRYFQKLAVFPGFPEVF